MSLTTPDEIDESNESESASPGGDTEAPTLPVIENEMTERLSIPAQPLDDLAEMQGGMLDDAYNRIYELEGRVDELEEEIEVLRETVEMVELPCGCESYDPDEAPPKPFKATCSTCGETHKISE